MICWGKSILVMLLCVRVTCIMVSMTRYIVRHSQVVTKSSKTYLDGPYTTRSVFECATMCKLTYKCCIAEYDETTSLCTYHEFSPVITVIEDNVEQGFFVLTARQRSYTLKLDPSSLHKALYISVDFTTIGGKGSAKMQKPQADPNQLLVYRGATTTTCIKTNQVLMFEVFYDYILHQPITVARHIVIEFGVAERNKIDNNIYTGSKEVGGWSYLLLRCNMTAICLEAYHMSEQKFKTFWSTNDVGFYKNGTFTVIVNRKHNVFTLFRGDNSDKIFEYTDVTSAKQLCPVVSVQGIDIFNNGDFISTIGIRKVVEIF